MELVLAALTEFWWTAPVAAAGAAGIVGARRVRRTRRTGSRTVGVVAAQHDLTQGRARAREARAAARIAQADLARVEAERAAGTATPDEVRVARRAVQQAQQTANAASADLRARRARIAAERAAIPARGADPSAYPLARLLAAHDAVAQRWLAYETDAARRIAFPTMSDARIPATAAYLDADAAARSLRPASATAKVTPAQFAAYRAAVERTARAFDLAEQDAWRRAGRVLETPPSPTARWASAAGAALARSAESLGRAVESATAAFDARRRRDGDDPERPTGA